jgi:hypothetical protein
MKSAFHAAVLLSAVAASFASADVITLNTAGGFGYDIDTATGHIEDGTSDAYDFYPDLWIAGTQFSSTSYTTSNNGRTITLAPITVGVVSVTRTIYVPANGGNYVAFLDSFTNIDNSPNSLAMRYGSQNGGSFGSDDATVVTATSSGDTNAALGDYWFATDDATPGYSGTPSPTGDDDPALGHVVGGPGGAQVPYQLERQSPDQYFTTFFVDTAAGQTKSFLFFETQEFTRTAAASVAASLSANPDVSFLTSAQIATIQNIAVPEPGSCLAGIAAAGLLLRRRR